MPPLAINLQARKDATSPEAKSARPRRYSIDDARRRYYQSSRTIRYAARFTH